MSTWKEPESVGELHRRLAQVLGDQHEYDDDFEILWVKIGNCFASLPCDPASNRNDLARVLEQIHKRKLFGQWRVAVQCYVEEREFSDDWYEKHGPWMFFMVAGDCRVLETLALKVLEESMAEREAQAATGFEVAL